MKQTKLLIVVFCSLLALLFMLYPASAQEEQGESGEETPQEGAGSFSMNGAMGATTINGKSYQYFSLRPDIPIWKFGVGLDLSFYFDADGKLREDDWDEAADIIDKIYYVRYGKPGQPLYIRAGSLSPITLGYGLIMRRYTNAIEWPQVRRIGMQTEVNIGSIKAEALLNNFRELDSPGLIGARFSYQLDLLLPVVFGGSIVHDGNQFLGAKDGDDDGIPNHQDMFPDKNDGDIINQLKGDNSPARRSYNNELIDLGILPDIYNPPLSIGDRDAPVTEYGLDVGVPLVRNKIMSLWVYAQAAQIVDYGSGYTVPGLLWNMGPFRASAEYRIFESKFQGDFFNYSYEVERVSWNEDTGDYATKDENLEGIPSAQGFYADAGADLFGWIDIFASYQQMAYDDDDMPNKSLYATAKLLKTSVIPKINLVEGYFQQPNADKLFSTESDGTVIGYRIGTSLGGGLSLVYDNRTIYQNGEPNRIMTIETVMRFK